jgi:hypothetical protein
MPRKEEIWFAHRGTGPHAYRNLQNTGANNGTSASWVATLNVRSLVYHTLVNQTINVIFEALNEFSWVNSSSSSRITVSTARMTY